MERDKQISPVLFRKDYDGGQWHITAVFPVYPGSVRDPYSMVCYAHIGQHSSCSWEWYQGTRPAKPAEYASLKAELESLGYNLKICHRITPKMRDQLQANRGA